MNKSVLILLPYPINKAPSQRFRVEAYFSLFANHNIQFYYCCFFDGKAYVSIYNNGLYCEKYIAVLRGFFRRVIVLFKVAKFDFVFIHREAAPIGPPLFEWIITKVLKKKVIYDFDDAIWIPNITASNSIARYLKSFWKVKFICSWSYKVSAGNEFLLHWASQFNNNTVYNPTCVDIEHRYNKIANQDTNNITIGWTGSHSTLKYLDLIVPILQDLENEYEFKFLVICNQPPTFTLKSLEFISWNEASEIEDLLRFNIGIMPLDEDEWSEGKCGFKLIQYLALGIPSVASPVGVNKNIIKHGINGFLCDSKDEWKSYLIELITSQQLRVTMGTAGRSHIIKNYSIQSNTSNFLSLFS